MNASKEMPVYRCHKKVWALKIKNVVKHAHPDPDHDDAAFEASPQFEGAHLFIEEPGYAPIPVDADWYRKHDPKPGGYYVVYQDGYKSYSPADAFEGGYTLDAGPTAGLSFSAALESAKDGKRIAREGWNGKGMWVCVGRGATEVKADQFWNPHTRAFAESNGGTAEVLPYLIMKTADGKILMGWLASQSDMLASDWCILD